MSFFLHKNPFFILKRVLFLFSFGIACCSVSYADHISGGEITAECLGANQYRITFHLYSTCGGTVPNPTSALKYSSVSCGVNNAITINRTSITEIPVSCATVPTKCNGGTALGIEEHTYSIILNLQGCNDWVFAIDIGGRNQNINTIANPGFEEILFETKINNLDFPCNNSPVFSEKSVPFVCVNQTTCINNGASDIDGDSLSYSFATPASTKDGDVNYLPGYSATQFITSNSLPTIDATTGDVCVTPTQVQISPFAVLVEEWRNGIFVGSVKRDMQITVITCNNTNPFLNGINNTGSYDLTACVGNPINFTIPSFDNDVGENVTLSWNNGIPGGTFNPGSGAIPTGTFSWNPTQSDIRAAPYCFSVTVSDDNCPIPGSQSYSFCITVGGFSTTPFSTDVICTNTNGTAGVQVNNIVGTPSFLWTPGGQTVSSLTGLAAGNYLLKTSDAFGCSITDNFTINSTNTSTASITSFNNVSCGGGNNGKIVTSLTGPSVIAPLTYTWTPGSVGNTNTANNLTAGLYSVIIRDAQGCADTIIKTITEPVVLDPNTNGVNIGCFGEVTGVATAAPTGGVGSYTYLWMPGAFTTSSISSLGIGDYEVTVKDGNNCIKKEIVTISQPNELSITDVIVDATCGQANGSATVTGSGGFPPYTWVWSDGQTGNQATNLAAAAYSVTMEDANLCSKIFPITVANNAAPTAQITTFNDITCNGDNDGSIAITASGGVPPYDYLWSNAGVTPIISNLSGGSYSVTITDKNNCVFVVDTVITEPTKLTNNFVVLNPLCFGDASGKVFANPQGGTTPYTYKWGTPGNPVTDSITNLVAGNYGVTITDANNCNITQNVMLTNPPTMSTVIDKTDANCFSSCDGTAFARVTNGVAPFSYDWDDPLNQTADTAKFLCAGQYQVNVTDVNGCTAQAITNITAPATGLSASVSSKGDLKCFQDCIGFVQITASGGVGTLSYQWDHDNTNTTPNAINLCAGTYKCTVTDDDMCTATVTVEITEPDELTATITGTDIKCAGECDGEGLINFSGGTAPYQFLWTPGFQTINNPNDLCPGKNVAKITDSLGCEVKDSVTLIQSFSPINVVSLSDSSNCGQSNGNACVTPFGGVPPYRYSWGEPSISDSSCITNVVGGVYEVEIIDDVGCRKKQIVLIGDIAVAAITINTQPIHLKCFGDTDGSVVTTISGGAPPFNIQWTPGGQTVRDPNNLGKGVNVITVTDAAGCVSSDSLSITEPTPINLALDPALITNNVCFDFCNGTATAGAAGGSGNISFLWDDPAAQNTATAINLCAGDYIVTATDDNNCEKTASITITEPDELLVDSSNFQNLKCFQDNSGSIFTSVSGGTPFYTFQWTPNISVGPAANGLPSGNYALKITDDNGCELDTSWVITEPNLLTGVSSSKNATCGFNNGNTTIILSGGTTPYSYQWNDPALQTDSIADNLFEGNYEVNVIDSNNCTFTQNYAIINIPGPVIDTVTSTPVSCFGGNNGTALVSLVPNIGTMPFTYTWNPGVQTLPNINGLSMGVYSVTVRDSNNCIATGNVVVNQPSLLELFTNPDDTICFDDTIQIYGQGLGGTPPYSYNWLNPGLNQDSVNLVFPAITTTYTVDITDKNNCPAGPADVIIYVLPPLSVTVSDTAMCEGDSIVLTAMVSGGEVNDYTYQWSTGVGDTLQTLKVAPTLVSSPIDYSIIFDDGCSPTAYDTATVIVNAIPFIDSITTVNVLCFGDTTGAAEVFLDPAVAQAPFQFDWGFTIENNPTIDSLVAGKYYVNVIDNNGCMVNDSIEITQPTKLTVAIFGDSICYGATGNVSAVAGGAVSPYVYSWSGIGTGTTLGAGPHQVSPTISTFYSLNLTDSNNCSLDTNVEVKVGQPLAVNASDIPVCENEDGVLNANPSGGDPSMYAFSWDNGMNTQSQIVTVNKTDTFYVVTLSDGCSTPATDTAFVTVHLKPIGSLQAFPRKGCPPLLVNFTAMSNDGIQHHWNYGDGSSVISTTSTAISHSYPDSGTYDIGLIIVNMEGCSTLVDSLNYITVFPQPVADFSMDPNPVSMLKPSVQFTDLSYANINNWQWDFSGLGIDSVPSPNYVFPEVAGNYNVGLKVIDTNGCIDSVNKVLTVKPEWAVYVPNSFTPDGDGVNDQFSPAGFGILETNYTFLVFDRWGEVLFKTHRTTDTWDGTYKGKLAKQDAYVWKVFFTDVFGEEHNRIGHVTLIR